MSEGYGGRVRGKDGNTSEKMRMGLKRGRKRSIGKGEKKVKEEDIRRKRARKKRRIRRP